MSGSSNPDTAARTAADAGAPAGFAGWEVDLPARAAWWSAQALALFALAPGSAPSMDETIAFCLPAHRARLRARLEACARDGAPFDEDIAVAAAGGRRIRLQASGRAVRGADGAVIRIQGAFRQTAGRRRPDDDAPGLAARLANTLDSMREAFFTLDSALHFTYLNQAAATLLQRGRAELVGKLVWEQFPAAVGGPSYLAYGRALRQQCPVSFEEFYPPLARWFEVRCFPTEYGLAVYFHDVTARKEERMALKQAHRALQMLSRCNHVVVHAVREADLIDQICRIAVEVGGYRMAWVGYTGDDEAHSIAIAAQAGNAADLACLRKLPLGWSEDDSAGRGPAGLAGAIYLPLKDGVRAFGLLSLYAHDIAGGDADELGLLQELADNLAFGISALRARREQARIQAAITKVAASVSTATGEHFFEQLASMMAEAVGADGGFVVRLLPGSPLRAHTVIAVVDGERVADFDYAVGDSPCALTLENEHYVVQSGVGLLFPDSPAAALVAQAYGGWRLRASNGTPIGIAFVLFRRPVPRSEFVTSTLRIFAVRAAAELERQDADANLRTQASLLDKAQDAIIVRSVDDDRVLFWNKSAERIFGWPRAEALGRRLNELLQDDPALFAAAKHATLERGHWSGEATRRSRDGRALTVQVGLSLISNDAGRPEAVLSINTDITERKAAERQIERLAFYDPTTGLPNRLLLLERLQHALTITGRSSVSGALLFIDLDNFKAVNDNLGHDKGDLLLQQVASRLRACVYEIDTVARFGGDEFVVLVENLSSQRHEAAIQARLICEKVLRSFGAPIMLDNFARHTTASIGVTLFDSQQCNAGELLKQADLAMYEVKAAGRNGVRFFDPEMQTAVTARAALEADLRHALQHDEFALHYQPQVDRGGSVIGAEALIRWHSASRGAVAPADFIPIAEDIGLILPIGRWVLEQACGQLALWARQPELAQLSVAVNVSARQLHQPGFVDEVIALIKAAAIDPRRLKLEITESLLVDDTETAIATMNRLRDFGVCFSLDDFGTGYSSLSYLKRLPLAQLKIDQSFVSDVLADIHDAAIAQTIIALGRCLQLNVIAEGVETAGQHAFLMEHGCHAFQGYLFSRAVPAGDFELFARARPPA
jgi:diguanylate cyclase (GGDEF)-like protein/PAS domain S-box-containing protein